MGTSTKKLLFFALIISVNYLWANQGKNINATAEAGIVSSARYHKGKSEHITLKISIVRDQTQYEFEQLTGSDYSTFQFKGHIASGSCFYNHVLRYNHNTGEMQPFYPTSGAPHPDLNVTLFELLKLDATNRKLKKLFLNYAGNLSVMHTVLGFSVTEDTSKPGWFNFTYNLEANKKAK